MSQVDKQYKSALLLVLIFAIAVVGFLAYQKYGSKDDAEKTGKKDEKVSINTVKKEDINQIELKTSNLDLILLKNNGKYELKDNAKLELDMVSINNVLDSISNLKANSIGDNITNMSDFGLALPRAKLSYKIAGVDGKTIEFGDKLLERGYYIRFSGENKVYMVEKAIGDTLVFDIKGIRNKQVLNINKDDINLIAINKKAETAFEAVADNALGAKWTIKKPGEIRGNDVKISDLLNTLVSLKVKDFLDVGKKSLADYGLETPSTTVKVGVKGGEPTKLYIGSEKQGQGRYIMKEGSNEIYLVESFDASLIGLTFSDVADKTIGGIVPTEVTSIEANIGADKLTLGIVHGKDPGIENDTVTVNNVQITDKKNYTEFINAYSSLVATDIKPGVEVSKDADLILSATGKDVTVKMAFVKKGDQEYYVLKNNKYSGQIIKKDALDTVIKALQGLKAAK